MCLCHFKSADFGPPEALTSEGKTRNREQDVGCVLNRRAPRRILAFCSSSHIQTFKSGNIMWVEGNCSAAPELSAWKWVAEVTWQDLPINTGYQLIHKAQPNRSARFWLGFHTDVSQKVSSCSRAPVKISTHVSAENCQKLSQNEK
ncbi:hypothetical protein CapIbe_009095 [Capra ibex]